MRFEVYPRFLQIVIKDNSPFLEKILNNAQKHFQQIHRLSNTLLILDDLRLIKKRYFLNWLAHLQDMPFDKDFLNQAHLPLRIKIDTSANLLYRIDAKMRIVDYDRVGIILSRDDLRARRCILNLFGGYICDSDNLILDSSKNGFWEYLMEIMHSRVVGNLVLKFDFQNETYLTPDEARLDYCYKILNSYVGESLTQIRKKYISLARKYHPDNVFGADSNTIKTYQQKFMQIQNAFEEICASLN